MKSIIRVAALAAMFSGIAIVTEAPVRAGTVAYSYDQLGRLSQAIYPNGAIIRYNYDPNGNRTSYVVTGSGNSPPSGTTPVGQAQIAPQPAQSEISHPNATAPPR